MSLSYVLAVGEAAAILIPLRGHTSVGVNADFARQNTGPVLALIALGIVGVAVAGALSLAPTLRWYVAGEEPTPEQRDAVMKLVGRQSAILVTAWAVSGGIFLLLNLAGGARLLLPIALGALLGGSAAAGTGMLLAQRTLRPIMRAATLGAEPRLAVPSVYARLVLLWFLCSAFPIAVIAALVVLRSYGWLVEKSASLDVPILVVSLAALVLGLPTMILTSRSISDPIGEVVDAMAEIEHGRMETYVGAYERSQIGRLQTGFNRMVAGLAERDRLRDLFGRHVGADVAQRAIEEGASLSGDVVEAAVLFIGLVGSTQLAESRPRKRSRRCSTTSSGSSSTPSTNTTVWSTNSPATPRWPSSGFRCRPMSRRLRRWRQPARSVPNYGSCQSISGSVCPRAGSSPVTSAPRTGTNTP